MSTTEQLATQLVDCLRGVRSLLQQARRIGLDEQDALVKNDAEALVRACKGQEEILRRIAEADRQAADVATDLATGVGIDPDNADPVSVAQAAGAPYDELIPEEMTRIASLAGQVKQVNEANRVLLANGLDIIACCMRTLATENTVEIYSQRAELSGSQPCVVSLDRRA